MELTIVEKSWIPKSIWSIPLQAHLLLFDSNLSTNIAQFRVLREIKTKLNARSLNFSSFSYLYCLIFKPQGFLSWWKAVMDKKEGTKDI